MSDTKSTTWLISVLAAAAIGGWSMYFMENRQNDAGEVRRIAGIEGEKQQITSPTNRATPSPDDAAEFEAAIAVLRSETDGLAEQLQIINSERERLDLEREQLNDRLVKAESKQVSLIAEREQLNDRLVKAESEQEPLIAEREQLNDRLAKAESEQESLITEREQLNDRLARAESEQESLVTEREHLNDRLVKAESEQELLVTEREQLRSSLAKAESERQRLESEQVQTNLTLQASNSKGERLSGEQAQLRTSLQMANDKLERLESERIRLRGKLDAAINERERLAAELKSMLEARRLLSSDLQKTREERDRLQLSLDLQIKLKKLELAVSAGRVIDLTTRLDNAGQIINLLQAEVQLLAEERDDVKTRITDLKYKLESGLPAKNVEIELHKNDRTVIRVTGDILFDTGSAELSGAGRQALGHIAAALIKFPTHQISLEGHTDTVPILGALRERYATNWELSIARAASAVRYLQLRGIDAARLRAVGYGEFRPVADNDDPQLRERNRRLEIRLLPSDEKVLEQDLSVSR